MADNPFGIALHDAIGPLDPAFTAQINVPPARKPEYSKGQIIAGIIADAIAGATGQAGPALAMWNRQRERDADQAKWQTERRARMEDWVAQQEYQRAHPSAAPHYFETNNGSIGMIGADGKPSIVYDDPTPKMNFIPDGLGGGQWVAVPGQAPTMPTQPVGGLKPVGNLTPIDGGPTASPSGGFRY